MTFKTKTLIAMGVTAFLIWSGMAYFDPTLRPDYLKFIIGIVVGIAGLVLREMPTQPLPHPPEKKDSNII
ncbi:hypothetical protein [Sulfuriferula sp.]|uniref:hypothetical protein n=1 Tax=Sulfuriferula sp. TaxID=2025307 RepID=UPI0027307767|nr:hypothetical protein [Sulfuriferula sp.]MDP2026465.1 hypothetical protein [Sulfuriferula sp.]